MMENRSFDHYLGWLPGADGLLDSSGILVPPRCPTPAGNLVTGQCWGASGTDFKNTFCGADHVDPDHGWDGGRVQFNNGANDGWLRGGRRRPVRLSLLPARGRARSPPPWPRPSPPTTATSAACWPRRSPTASTCTRPRRAAGGTTPSPTSSDEGAGGTSYVDREGGFDWLDHLGPARRGRRQLGVLLQRPARARAVDRPASCGARRQARSARCSSSTPTPRPGTLPQVFFIDPDFVNEENGNDDHPHADIRAGQAYMADVYHALRGSPQWPKLAFFLTYDEWGGFYDHVPPPRVRDERANAVLGRGLRPARVPGADAHHLAVGPAGHQQPHLRPRVDPQVHRVPLPAGAADGARRVGGQHRRGARRDRARQGAAQPRAGRRPQPRPAAAAAPRYRSPDGETGPGHRHAARPTTRRSRCRAAGTAMPSQQRQGVPPSRGAVAAFADRPDLGPLRPPWAATGGTPTATDLIEHSFDTLGAMADLSPFPRQYPRETEGYCLENGCGSWRVGPGPSPWPRSGSCRSSGRCRRCCRTGGCGGGAR